MRLFIEKIFRKLYAGHLYPHTKISYSQNGEDIIIKDLFSKLGIRHPTYLDIGANEPYKISNTYLLYTKGSEGVCVEPNPQLYSKFKKSRRKDTCINAGIAFDDQTEADFYLFPEEANGLGTFSKQEAEFWQTTGNTTIGRHKIKTVIKVKLVRINELISEHFATHPNFLSIDVEGLDLAILKTLDFTRFKPEVICVETLGYSSNNKEFKNEELINYLVSKGYFVYADTYINTIFCDASKYTALSIS